MRFFGLKNCDTCRKALRALTEKGHAVEVVDVRADGVPRTDLDRFHAAFGADIVNRRSTTWRTLSETERQGDPLELLERHPTLMKRPVIDVDGTLYLGWTDKVRAQLLT